MIVKYSKKFPYAPFLNEDIGFEMEIPTDSKESAMLVLKELKEMAEKFHKDNNPQLVDVTNEYKVSDVQGFQPIPSIIPTIDPRAYDIAEKNIDNATTIKDLEFYADIAVKYGLVEMYLNKKKQLSQ